MPSILHLQDTESLSTVAVKILGINPQAGKVTIAAAKPLAW